MTTSVISANEKINMKMNSKLQKALSDIVTGLSMWRVWLMLGYQDIRLRYRRSSLGPFWITLSMAVTIYSLGILYSHLMSASYHEYMLYFGSGLLIWSLIVTVVNESATVFYEAKGYLLQMHIPFSIFVLRLMTRNVIVFFHNLLALIPLIIYFHSVLNWDSWLVIPDLLLIMLPLFVVSMLLAIIGLRFRDIGQLVTSLMNLAFFITPIMWLPNRLPEKMHFILKLNPFAQFIELVRAPLMGQLPALYAVLFTSGVTVMCFITLIYFLSKFRHRIVFWL